MPTLPAVGFITLIVSANGPLLTHEPYWVFKTQRDCDEDKEALANVARAAGWTISCVPGTAHGPKKGAAQ